ncbi:MAG: hypothetical protein GY697_23090 [Desulfobacterales bacterium]|nr:hypothetical protein [Desulfobacterales bacterium]
MVRKITVIGIALIGITLASGGNAWAERNRGDKGQRNDKGYHQKHKNPPGHHYGWKKGNGNPHRDRHYKGRHQRKHSVKKHVYHHVPKRHHRVEKRVYRHGPKRHRRVEKRVYRHVPKRHRRVEKRVYHHYPKRQIAHGDQFNIAFSVVDEFFGFGMAVSSNR